MPTDCYSSESPTLPTFGLFSHRSGLLSLVICSRPAHLRESSVRRPVCPRSTRRQRSSGISVVRAIRMRVETLVSSAPSGERILPESARRLQLFSLLRVSVHFCHVVSASYQPVADPAPHVPCSDNGDVHTHPPRCPYLTRDYRTRAGHVLLGHLCTMRRADFRENAYSRSHLMNERWWGWKENLELVVLSEPRDRGARLPDRGQDRLSDDR